MQNKIFRMVMLLVLGMFILPVNGLASRQLVHELNYFQQYQTKVDGRDALRIEIGMDHANLDYKVAVNPLQKDQLTIDFDNSRLGGLKSYIALDGKIGQYVMLRELGRRHIQLKLTTKADLTDSNYKVYTLDAERKSGKPYRLVIEILAPQPSTGMTGTAAGVAGRTIVLDPGHGGSDSGAVGPDGIQEKDVTLAVARLTRTILQNSGAHVVMTRDSDVDVYGPNATDRQELQARVDVGAYTPGMNVFVSIHCNSFSSASATGTETFYYPKSEKDAILAQDLQDALVAAGGRRDRGISEANFYVVKHTDTPAALVELAFISNYTGEALLNSEDFQAKMALAIAQGLGKFFQDTGA